MPINKNNYGKEYWINREKAKLNKSLKDVDKLDKLLVREYKKSIKSIEKEISHLYDKYAKDNKLSYFEANKNLMSDEFKVWRMDLKDYIKASKGDEKLLLELNTLAMKSRISRLEEMLYQCDKYIDELYETSYSGTTKLLTDTLASSYYETIYDTQKYVGVGTSFAHVDNKMVKEVLSFPWSGLDYSSRIWNNRGQLKKVIHSEITQMIIRGEASLSISKRVAKKMDTSLFNARRLINTEHAYVCSQGDKMAYEELEVDKYQYVATLDRRTSTKCQSLDGKIFNTKDSTVGLNCPPLHCFCRSTTVPYIDDSFVSTRAARNKNGKTYEVPSDMTYSDWENLNDID